MATSKYEVPLMFKQKPPIPYQFQSALWVHRPRLCLQVLYIKRENVITGREVGREGGEGEREGGRENILFKKLARVPSVTDSPMKGTTASNLSPI